MNSNNAFGKLCEWTERFFAFQCWFMFWEQNSRKCLVNHNHEILYVNDSDFVFCRGSFLLFIHGISHTGACTGYMSRRNTPFTQWMKIIRFCRIQHFSIWFEEETIANNRFTRYSIETIRLKLQYCLKDKWFNTSDSLAGWANTK